MQETGTGFFLDLLDFHSIYEELDSFFEKRLNLEFHGCGSGQTVDRLDCRAVCFFICLFFILYGLTVRLNGPSINDTGSFHEAGIWIQVVPCFHVFIEEPAGL